MGKIYVVFVGRKPGIYDNWEEAHNEVNKFSGASHKSYRSREEAVKAFDAYMKKQSVATSFAFSNKNCSASSSNSSENSKKIVELADAQSKLAHENREHAARVEKISEEIKKILESLHL